MTKPLRQDLTERMRGSPTKVGSSAWLELLHAEAAWLMEANGVDALVLKGPSSSDLLERPSRSYADVDLLIRPQHWSKASAALRARGFEAVYAGVRVGEVAMHSLEFQRPDPTQGGQIVDLHQYLPGVDRRAVEVFDLLWATRVRHSLARIEVQYLSRPARGLVIAIHAARTPIPRNIDDLRQLAELCTPEDWEAIGRLAMDLHAAVGLKAGIELLSDHARVASAAGISDVTISGSWRLQAGGGNQVAIRLDQLRNMPLHSRPMAVIRWVFPSRAFMEHRDARAGSGSWGLAAAHAARWRDGLRQVGPAVRSLRSLR
jgi:hypothetical protein